MKEQFERIKFNTWQELAKYVIDGGEVYVVVSNGGKERLLFNGVSFNYTISAWHDDVWVKKQPTLEELIAIKPRLCWVWDHGDTTKEIVRINKIKNNCYHNNRCWWSSAQMLTDDEIKQFLSDGDDK